MERHDSIATALFNRYATRDASEFKNNSAFPVKTNHSETFVISLGEENPRWYAANERLQQAGFLAGEFRRWPAVDGKALSADANASQIIHPRTLYSLSHEPVCLYDIESWGTIGCYLSHWSIWKYVVDQGLDFAVVFEDDVVPRTDIFENQFPQVISSLIKEARGTQNFDFMRMEWIDFNGAKIEPFSDNLNRSRGLVVNMCAYVVTNRGAKRLLAQAFPINDPIDMYLTFLERTDPSFISLLSKKILTVQDRRNFQSQIATNQERRDRRESICSAVLSDSIPNRLHVNNNNAVLFWIAIGALVLLLFGLIAMLIAIVTSSSKRRRKEQEVSSFRPSHLVSIQPTL